MSPDVYMCESFDPENICLVTKNNEMYSIKHYTLGNIGGLGT